MKICPLLLWPILMALLFSGCPKKTSLEPECHIFAKAVCSALLKGDEKAFVDFHVKEGDMPSDKKGYYATKTGGKLPDYNWTQLVQRKYREARRWIERKVSLGESLTFEMVIKAEFPPNRDKEAKDCGYLDHMLVKIRSSKGSYVMEFGVSRLSQRGRILMEDPGVNFYTWEEFEKKFRAVNVKK